VRPLALLAPGWLRIDVVEEYDTNLRPWLPKATDGLSPPGTSP
jgi:hypothetical protein